jgi:hypothetical protein
MMTGQLTLPTQRLGGIKPGWSQGGWASSHCVDSPLERLVGFPSLFFNFFVLSFTAAPILWEDITSTQPLHNLTRRSLTPPKMISTKFLLVALTLFGSVS